MLKVIPVVLFLGAAAFVSTSNLRDARADGALKVPVVTIHAKDFSFDAPKSIASGLTTFRLVNDGKELHHVTIIKLDEGKTMKDLEASMNAGHPEPPAWAQAVGGPNAAVPGATIEATLDLAPGNYVLICFIPSPGEQMPHAAKGMVLPLTVTPSRGVTQAGATDASALTPNVHLVLKDYGFAFSKPITAGKHTIHIMNEGQEDHEAILLQLAPGKRLSDFTAWASTGMKGPPPARPMAGIAPMAKGRTAIVTDDFTPGSYALTCFVTAPDKKLHAEHGMNLEFEVK